MLYYALVFFIIAIIAAALGFGGIYVAEDVGGSALTRLDAACKSLEAKLSPEAKQPAAGSV